VNPLKSRLQRTTAVLAGTVLGVAGAVALAAPASAHHTTVTGTTACTPSGDWTVTWKVVNSESNKVGTVKDVVVTPAGKPVTTIVVDAEIPKGGEIVGTQALSKDDATASLKVLVKWLTKANGYPDNNPPKSWDEASVNRPEYCTPTTVPPTTVPPTTVPPTTVPPTTVPPTTVPPTTVPPTTVPPTTTPATTPPTTVPPTTSPTPDAPGGGGGGDTPTLPKTGVALGGVVGGAALLLAVGVGLFFLARRRRVKFTA
jgi:LPXTG-motif cell wall-anchored protein